VIIRLHNNNASAREVMQYETGKGTMQFTIM